MVVVRSESSSHSVSCSRTGIRRCSPVATRRVLVFCVGFRWSGSVFPGRSGCSGLVFDTPIDISVRNGFRGVRGVRVCVGSGFGVGFSLAARRGAVPPAWGFGSGSVRWWFENSRACFVLLLYSQMIASPSYGPRVFLVRVPGSRLNGAGFLRTAPFS